MPFLSESHSKQRGAGISISNPPTQGELQAVLDKVNELIGSLQR